MTTVDTAIMTALNTNGISWCPAMNTQSGVILTDAETTFPVCIQAIESETELLDSGMTKETIRFYMAEEKGEIEDVLQVKDIFTKVDLLIDAFRNTLKNSIDCEIVGKRQKALDTLPNLEAGITFTMELKYLCKT